jgi:hypothetical protein
VKFVRINTAVVVVAKAHNPSILHPSFLRAQNIVPVDWELAGNPVSTPAVSAVKYANGITFIADSTRLVIRDEAPRKTDLVHDLAIKYVNALPHVHYSAVGINFDGYIECPNPEDWARERFLKRGPGNDDKLKPNAVGLKFAYAVDQGVLNLSCDSGTVRRASENHETPCLLISANYSLPVSEVSIDDARNAINSYFTRLAHFSEITDSIFGLETESHADSH